MISVGIDIGEFSIKIAVVDGSSKNHTLVRYEELPIHQDPSADRRLAIVDHLRNLASQLDPQQTRYCTAVDQDDVSLRLRNFPFRERHKILKSVAFELEDDIPFSMEDAIFEAKVVQWEDSSAEVIALACPKENLKDRLDLIHDGGISPTVMSVEGIALNNLFEAWLDDPPKRPPSGESVEKNDSSSLDSPSTGELIIDLGHRSTLVLTHREGVLVDARNIDLGGHDLAKAIETQYKIHYVEALKQLVKKSFLLINEEGATRDQIQFSNTLKKALEPLAQELKLILIELESEYHIHFENIRMIGGLSRIKNIGAFLTEKTGLPVNRLKQFPLKPTIEIGPHASKLVTGAVALGLAIEGLKRPKNPAVNLLKGEFAIQSQTTRLFFEKWGHTLKVASAALVLLLIYSFVRDGLSESLRDTGESALSVQAKKVAGLKGRKANARNAKKFINKQKQIAKNKKLIQDLQKLNSAMDVLKQISERTPDKRSVQLNVNRLNIDNENVQIEGNVRQRSSINSLKNALQSMALGGKVQAGRSTLRPTRGWQNFSFRFQVSRRDGGSK